MKGSFLINTSLQMENRSLKREIKSFKNGARYQKLQNAYRLIIRGYKREIKRLQAALDAANKQIEAVRNMWYEQSVADWEKYQAILKKKDGIIERLSKKIRDLIAKCDENIVTHTSHPNVCYASL